MLDPLFPILLVEDDEVDIEDIKRTFRKNKFQNPLYVVSNGREALNKLLGINGEARLSPLPKVILLDINMPKMNGLEFLAHLREHPQFNSMLVFVLTSSDADRDKMEAFKYNVSGYMLKPFEFVKFTNNLTKPRD